MKFLKFILMLGILWTLIVCAYGAKPQPTEVACSELKMGQVCHTSIPAQKCFQIIQDPNLGISIQEMSDPKSNQSHDCSHPGTIWARWLQKEDVDYEMTQNTCPPGTQPPTKEDFVRLRDSMGTEPNPYAQRARYFYPDLNKIWFSDEGRAEFYALFPDMRDHWFWVSPSPTDLVSVILDFDGHSGVVDDDSYYHRDGAVRCLKPVRKK